MDSVGQKPLNLAARHVKGHASRGESCATGESVLTRLIGDRHEERQ